MVHVQFDVRWRVLVLVTLILSGMASIGAQEPAAANHDGPPVIGEEGPAVPQVHRPAGGSAVRIYGEGLLGATAVRFGGALAPDFRVVDGDLIIATVPPAAVPLVQNDGFAHITVTDDQGTGTTDLDGDGTVDLSDCSTGCAAFGAELGAIFYTDATMTVSPSTGLDDGESVTATVAGHRPNQPGWAFVQLNPLVNFLEDGPADPDSAPPGPAYGVPITFTGTNGTGATPPTVLGIAGGAAFNAKDQDYDADADCPVAQVTANHGLSRCLMAYSEFGMASLETPFSYSPDVPNLDPVPAAPTLNLTPGSGAPGTSVTISGTNWSAAPHFGSDTAPNDPGETTLTIEICNLAQTVCAPAGSPAANVAVTRYFDTNPASQPVTPLYTGATLSGSFTVAGTAGCAPSCVVRVRQQRHDILANAPVGGSFITATANLSIGLPRRAVADFDGNGTTDRSVFRNGAWYAEGQAPVFFGLPGDIPVPADYDGNGTADRAVYRDGAWYAGGQATVFFGLPGDIPVPGDYDGNGDAEHAIYRPSVGGWYVEGLAPVFFGLSGDIPVPADYDGNGTTDRAVFRDGAWYVHNQPTAFIGLAGDVPVPGDYDGSGDAERAVFRPSASAWFVEGQAPVFLGQGGDVAVPGDYDGNGTTDRAVFRAGAWFVHNQPTVFLGLGGDIPLPLPQGVYRRFY